MKKVNTPVAEKKVEKNCKKKNHIKFNPTPGNLACFKGKSSSLYDNSTIQTKKEIHQSRAPKDQPKTKLATCLPVRQICKNQRLRSISILPKGTFNQKVVFMEYDNFDVYVDKTTKKKTSLNKSRSPSQKKIKYENEDEVEADELVSSCVRVITQETDNTSQPYSLSNSLAFSIPQKQQDLINYYNMMQYYPSRQQTTTRNKRSVTFQESKAFIIDYDRIDYDGRTTIMVKNIPNKYDQKTLLDQFIINHDNTIDFFYLPIDKDNQCNVGYAFVNFINTQVIKKFYLEFHGKRWKKYNSAKICNLCYARYQGTLELANHFRHTKILQQKDKKLRPLIGLYEASKIKGIQEIVKNQRIKQ